jgi:hypothetical protein
MSYVTALGHPLVCVAEGSLTVDGAVGIPADDLDKAKGGEMEVLLGVETDQVRLSVLTTATAASMLFDVGDKIRVAGPQSCRAISLIKVTNTATVRYQIFGKPI